MLFVLPVVRLSELITGATLVAYVKDLPALVPPGPTTTTLTLPARCAGAVKRSWVADSRVKDSALPPSESRVAPVKPEPLTVTTVDAVVRPVAGLSELIAGRVGVTGVQGSALLVP